jgi:hypothetical protein
MNMLLTKTLHQITSFPLSRVAGFLQSSDTLFNERFDVKVPSNMTSCCNHHCNDKMKTSQGYKDGSFSNSENNLVYHLGLLLDLMFRKTWALHWFA